jgi:3-hexulose-6-phosphate synthase
MKLQLALDTVSLTEARRIVDELQDLIDIVEIGTPCIFREGVNAVREIKKAHPGLEVLADLKIMDAGDYEARLAYDAGADIVTVLGVATDVTIRRVVQAAQDCRKQVLVDMIAVKHIEERAVHIDTMGVDYICVHTAFDLQEHKNPLDDLKRLSSLVQQAKVAVAGGIDAQMLKNIVPYAPDIIIVGGAITKQSEQRNAALEIREIMP